MVKKLSLPGITVFDRFAREYDHWFVENSFAYLSEVEAIRRFIPDTGLGVEIGAGTGRFSTPFGIKIGIEPAEGMARLAQSRGLFIIRALAEELPFADGTIDYVLMVTVICFLTDLPTAMKEIRRVLKPGGRLIIGFIDRESRLGRNYESMKESNRFYKWATFYSVSQVMDVLTAVGFSDFQVCQTLFTNPGDMVRCDPVSEGHGEGSFVVLMGTRQPA
ncbi:MAG: methyltransferase domain-containing protein [Nitrospirae bacterium]|nr:methyltransferase domain-containing protein [Nitrospirota bacterium]